MTSDSWSLILSIAGLLLGFISAYGQIKGFFVRLFKTSGDAIVVWRKKRAEKVELRSTFPSALVAYIARSTLFVAGTALVSFTASKLIESNLPTLEWLRGLVLNVSAVLAGFKLGVLHTTVLNVSKRTLELAKQNRNG